MSKYLKLGQKQKDINACEFKSKDYPMTKIIIPAHLKEDDAKKRKAYIKEKEVGLNYEKEKKRIDKFLEMLDIKDL